LTDRKKNLDHILALLNQSAELSVQELADNLQVSTMTIRRYLDEMETTGQVKRSHGKARIVISNAKEHEPYILGRQIEKNAEVKQRIGQAAASLIKPDQMVFLDSGSTIPYLVKSIDPEMGISVLCYTFQTALEFYRRRNTKLILAGGYYDHDSDIFSSNRTIDLIKDLRADTAFISTGGVDRDLGLTTYFYLEADIKKAFIASAKEVILVTDSTKFGKVSITYFADPKDIDVIVTDAGITDEYRQLFDQLQIKVLIV